MISTLRKMYPKVFGSEDESDIEETVPEDAEEQAGMTTSFEGTVSQTSQPLSTAEPDVTETVPIQQFSSDHSPPHPPVRIETTTWQPSVETSAVALFAVTADTSALDANDSEQHTLTATGTTTTDIGNSAMSEIGSPERESSFHGATKASAAVIADAVSFGMTSAQPQSPATIATTAEATSPTATYAQLLPIFPVMPAFVVSLMAGVNRSALILPDDNSSIPLLDQLSNLPGCSPNPPGSNPNPPGCNPIPPGSKPNPPGSIPNPPGCYPDPLGCNPMHPGCNPNPPGCDPDHLGYHPKGDNPYPMGNDLLLNPMANHLTHYPMSGNPSMMGNNPNAMGYNPSNIPYMGAPCMFPESTRGATWTNLNNAGIRDQGPANGMYAAEQANLPIPLESHFISNTGRYRRLYAHQEVRDNTPEELLQGQAPQQQFAPQHQQQPAINPAIGQLNYSVEWVKYFSQVGNEVNDRQESDILQWQLSPAKFLVDHGTGQWKDSGPASDVHEQCDRMESESSDVDIDIKLLRPLDLSSDDKMSSVEYVTSDRGMYNPDSEGEEDGYAVSVGGPATSQLDSAFQPYRGRLKGLQGQWDKVGHRGSGKEKTEEKGKNRQKKKIGRKK